MRTKTKSHKKQSGCCALMSRTKYIYKGKQKYLLSMQVFIIESIMMNMMNFFREVRSLT
jgi:hypothetical protein